MPEGSLARVLPEGAAMCRSRGSRWVLLALVVLVVAADRGYSSDNFRRGDSNADGVFNLTDPIDTLRYLFLGGSLPSCMDAVDSNDDGKIDLTDSLYSLTHLFLSGPAPPAPGLFCGTDNSADTLDCDRYTACPAGGIYFPFVNPGFSVGRLPASIASGDIDIDGRVDLLVGNSGSISTLINTGQGLFSPVNYSIDGSSTAILTDDIDRDGVLDVVVAAVTGESRGSIYIFRNAGNGTFDFSLPIPISGEPYSITVGDFDGDSYTDIAIVVSFGYALPGQLCLLKNSGGRDLAFESCQALAICSMPNAVALGDFDDDGDSDIVTAGLDCAEIMINDGTSTFTSTSHLMSHDSFMSVSVGDLDGTGTQDIAVLSHNGFVALLYNSGDATFQTPQNAMVEYEGIDLRLLDMDSDADLDIATASDPDYGYDGISLLLNSGTGSFQEEAKYKLSSAEAIIGIDRDSDGDVDMAAASAGANAVFIVNNTGFGVLEKFPEYRAAEFASLAVADFDLDADIDIVFVAEGCWDGFAGIGGVLKNEGRGTFEERLRFVTSACPLSIAAADFDGDTKVDIAMTDGPNSNSHSVFVARNEGDATFTKPLGYRVSDAPGAIAWADIDADGDFDIVATSGEESSSNDVYVLRNSGNGAFDSHGTYAVGIDPYAIAVNDMDNDGSIDIVVANQGEWDHVDPDTVSVITNLGSGVFREQVQYNVGRYPRSVSIGDIDNNGFMDIVIANEGGKARDGSISFLMNDAGGVFQVVNDQMQDINRPDVVAVADLELDGDADVVISNGPSIFVSPNEGNAIFAPRIPYHVGGYVYTFMLADCDADGDTDMAALHGYELTVLFNQAFP